MVQNSERVLPDIKFGEKHTWLSRVINNHRKYKNNYFDKIKYRIENSFLSSSNLVTKYQKIRFDRFQEQLPSSRGKD